MQKSVKNFDLSTADLELERPRATLAEVAADKLREFILLEKLPPGAAISEREVAALLGISRTPLRGALAILEQDGLVEYSITRRPHVANPSLEEIAQYLVVMGALEALGGELACTHATDADIARITALDAKMQDGSGQLDPLEFFSSDMEMHERIVQASGNAALIETHKRYNARLWRARFISSRRSEGRDQTLAEHAAIIAALSARDPEKTARAMRRHLLSAITNIQTALAERDAEKE